MKTILITGANGQLGRKINDVSVKTSELEFIFTDLPETDITNVDSIDKIFAENKIDIIINCAAYTAVDKAEDDQENAYQANAKGPEILAKKAAETGAKFIHISTDYVFDGQANTPYIETDVEKPVSVYGRTKLEGEKLAIKNSSDCIIIRTSWLYSEYGNNFAKTMLKLATEKEKLNVVFDQIGTPTYAGSLAKAVLKIVLDYVNLNTWKSGIYHYSDLGVCSWYDFAVFLLKQRNLNTPIFPVRSSEFVTRTQRPAYSVLDKSKIIKTYNISIPYWTDACLEMLRKL
ncbi:MAG: dTDP-4-dehydrorhamnose reductase [Bacteroidales bacterium]|nr:dTDP-4-dehydrorhamnose reductase [Bacteroidales bacterium]